MNVLTIPEILLPKKNVDKTKWSVIACDQFTSEPEYWNELDMTCGDVSTLRLIYPEIYIGKDETERIKKINAAMDDYLENGVFDRVKGFILSARTTKYGRRRVGIVAAFDLEEYDPVGRLSVRATEAVVPERLPTRIRIRENASLELPHALLLIDDEKKSVIEPLYERRNSLKKLYSVDLNMGGGKLEGYLVEDADSVINAIRALTDSENLKRKYGDPTPFVFAVGDGNHSIATAKACWDKLKPSLSESERKTHPARYCLAEINNIYDDELVFEPIYRAVFGAGDDFIREMRDALFGDDKLKLRSNGREYFVNVSSDSAKAIKDVQEFIDGYIAAHDGVSQDYIHGEDHLKNVVDQKKGIAVYMPRLKKGDLFKYVAKNGVLTRKSFSMGEAEEKRYYYECRRIK